MRPALCKADAFLVRFKVLRAMLLRLQRLLKGLFGAIVWEFVGGFLLEWCLLGSGWMEFSVVVRSCFGSCAFGIVVFIFSSSFSSFLFFLWKIHVTFRMYSPL